MAKKIEKFTPNKKVLEMKEGRTNFAECTPEFLAHMEFINKGTGELSDIKARYADELASAENGLRLYLKGTVISSNVVKDFEDKIAELKDKKNAATKEIRNYMPKMTDADNNLYAAYFWYQTAPEKESYDGEYITLYQRAFIEWFDSFGMTMGKKDFGFFSTKLGLKKAGNKTYRESGATQFTSAMGPRQFIELLYSIIIELMVKKGIIKNYEFTYTPQAEEEQAQAEAPKADTPKTEAPQAEQADTTAETPTEEQAEEEERAEAEQPQPEAPKAEEQAQEEIPTYEQAYIDWCNDNHYTVGSKRSLKIWESTGKKEN